MKEDDNNVKIASFKMLKDLNENRNIRTEKEDFLFFP